MYVLAPAAVVHRATHDNHRHHGRLRLADAGVCEVVVVELPPLHQQAAVGRHCMYVCKLVIDAQTHTPRQIKQHREEYTQSTHAIVVYGT